MNSQKFRLCVRSCQALENPNGGKWRMKNDRKILKNLEIWVNRCWRTFLWFLSVGQHPDTMSNKHLTIYAWPSKRCWLQFCGILSPLLISRGYGRNGCDETDLKICGEDFFRGELWDCCLTSLPLTPRHVRVISKESLQDLATRYPEKSKPKDGRLARDTQAAVKWASPQSCLYLPISKTDVNSPMTETGLEYPGNSQGQGRGGGWCVDPPTRQSSQPVEELPTSRELGYGDPQRTIGRTPNTQREVPITKERLGSWHPGSTLASFSSMLQPLLFPSSLWHRIVNESRKQPGSLGNGGEAVDHASFSLQATSQSWAHQMGWVEYTSFKLKV